MQTAEPPSPAPTPSAAPPDGWRGALLGPAFPVVAFLTVGAVLGLTSWLSLRVIGQATSYGPPTIGFPGDAVLGGWFRYDGGWYRTIALDGYYSLGPDAQSPVAFFPAYPLTMRLVGLATGDVVLAGVITTFAAGLATATLLHRWVVAQLGSSTARLAVAAFLLYPFAYYLFGAVYADALFLAATLGAFVLLERGHPVWAGLAGAVATATRPVGLAVVVGLVAVTLWRSRRSGTPLRPADAGVLLSGGGLAAWCAYLWVRFGDPLLFQEVQGAWGQSGGPRTWFKVAVFERLPNLPGWISDVVAGTAVHDAAPWIRTTYTFGLLLQGLALLGALLLVPRVFRRLGWGYGAYVVVALLIPLLGSKDFQGTGRYVLAAFPCFAVGAELLAERPTARWLWLGASGALLVFLTSAYARGYYVS